MALHGKAQRHVPAAIARTSQNPAHDGSEEQVVLYGETHMFQAKSDTIINMIF